MALVKGPRAGYAGAGCSGEVDGVWTLVGEGYGSGGGGSDGWGGGGEEGGTNFRVVWGVGLLVS